MNDPQMSDSKWAGLVADARKVIAAHPRQPDARERYLKVLAAHGAGALDKGRQPVHLTASLVILDSSLTQVLLNHHRKAQLWLPMGGHLEVSDATLRAGALREGAEESGLAMPARATLIELDAHLLGLGFTHCREHLDVRFAVAVPAQPPIRSAESHQVAWWPIHELPQPRPDDLERLVAAAQRALTTQSETGNTR